MTQNEVSAHYDYLLAVALKMCNGNLDKAEDVVQDTMIRAFGACGRYEAKADVKTWLYSILKNVMADSLRRPKHGWGWTQGQFVQEVTITEKFQLKSDYREPLEILQSEEAVSRINRALNTLRPSDLTILQLSIDGLSDTEIATRTSKTPGAIRSQLHRIREDLQKRLLTNN